MSWILRQAVAKRVLDRQLEEIDKEMNVRDTTHQKDLKDLRYEIQNQERLKEEKAARKRSGRRKLQVPDQRVKSHRDKGKSSPTKGVHFADHRHSIDISDLVRLHPDGVDSMDDIIRKPKKEEKGSEIINQMQSILNQTRDRSSKTPDEIWQERFHETFPDVAARIAISKTKSPNQPGSSTPKSSKSSENTKAPLPSYMQLAESRKPIQQGAGDVPSLNLGEQNGENRKIRVSFIKDSTNKTANRTGGKREGQSKNLYRVGDTDGAWRSARKARYLRGYDPPEMVLPKGDSGSFVFGRDFNEALVETSKPDEY
ncbi:hypothetical protein SNE40_010235 [Patella caerulea]|uniref:Uncharacterized protein n=1 Tax=Patella caerulea TaxID=87958 RepID=A0AAN8JXJ1_PATCE